MRCRHRGLSPRTVRWTHIVLKIALDYAVDERPTHRQESGDTKQVSADAASHAYLTHRKTSRRAIGRLWGSRLGLVLANTGLRFGERTGLNVEDVDIGARAHSSPPLRYPTGRLSRRAHGGGSILALYWPDRQVRCPHPGVEQIGNTTIDLQTCLWPGPGSNRRPSAFQAVVDPSEFRLPWSARCESADLDPMEQLD
jgi:hypothetical protein